MITEANWPAHGHRVVPWQMSGRGPREDRMVREIETSLPPFVADLDLQAAKATELAVTEATSAIAALDAGAGARLSALGGFLLRSESVSSSRIEHVCAARDDFAKAVAGVRATEAAKSTVAAIEALTAMVNAAGHKGLIELDDLMAAHHTLMKDDWNEKAYAGRIRDMQNWIGGSDYSPRNAIHVPPPPDLVAALMDDLIRYCNRTDVPVVTQAAIAHAQFESIHPFTDGNGRIGRALISAVIRRRGLAARTVVPIASAMLADTTAYFDLINNYRDGAADKFVRYVANSAVVASEAAAASAIALETLPVLWREMAHPRKGSADEKIIDRLLDRPVLGVYAAQELAGSSYSSANQAMDRLAAAGVVTALNNRARDRAWVATEVLDEIDRMNDRIGRRIAMPPG